MSKFLAITAGFIIVSAVNIYGASLKYISYQSLYNLDPPSRAEGTIIAQKKTLELAKLLDKGRWYGQIIRNTVVLNYTDQEFFVIATLGNGRSVRLYIDKLIKAANSGRLLLTNNRLLIFPYENSSQFDVFDKTEFYNLALTAKFYKKRYPISHPLSNLTIYYGLKRFDYISNSQYRLELLNGGSVKLNIEDSYKALKDNLLLASVNAEVSPVFDELNWISAVDKFSKIDYDLPGIEDQNLKTFGIRVSFATPVNYSAKGIPFYISRSAKGSFVDFIIPNSVAVKTLSVSGENDLEYINRIRVINDKKENYTTIRASFYSTNFDTIDLMWQQPQVYVHPDKKNIFLTFFHDPLQVINYGSFDWSESQLLAKKNLLNKSLKLLTENDSNQFVKLYNDAVRSYNNVLSIKHWRTWLEQFKTVSQKFVLAAKAASHDSELKLALRGRNLSIDHLFNVLLVNDIYPIIQSDNFSKNSKLLNSLANLNLYTRAHAAKEAFIRDVRILYGIDRNLFRLMERVDMALEFSKQERKQLKSVLNSELSKLKKITSSNKEVGAVKGKLLLMADLVNKRLTN